MQNIKDFDRSNSDSDTLFILAVYLGGGVKPPVHSDCYYMHQRGNKKKERQKGEKRRGGGGVDRM